MKKLIVISVSLIFMQLQLFSQQTEVLIDEVVAVVGNRIILESDLETQLLQHQTKGLTSGKKTMKCEILEDLMIQKLFVNQAEADSIEITDNQLENALNQRIRYFTSQFGSQEKLENFYGKSIMEIKNEFRDLIKEQMMAEEAQQQVIEDIKVTPSEIRAFYKSIPADSIYTIPTEFEIGQIIKKPPVSTAELNAVRNQLKTYRNRILAGERFETFAALYSEDPGSASRGGELGFYRRGELYPEFEAVAFRLEKGEISDIVKTKAGYHIIQMLERRGETINVRHILLRPKPSPVELEEARNFLDSLAGEIRAGNITYEQALEYSDDPGKMHGGLMINPYTGTPRFESEHLEPSVYFVADKMKIGEISNAVPFLDEEGYNAYRLLYLKDKTTPHKANLNDDYDRIKNWALENKQHNAIVDWVKEKNKKTYINIIEAYRDCDFKTKWIF
ncbi:MAG: peptidylprolyl isomerase [Bacteroidales bacterium]